MGRVVICGAGPAGAVLAYNLAERGVEVALLERHVDFSREFRGEELAPMGRAVLAQMGLDEELDRLPQREITSTDVYRKGRLRFRVPWVKGDVGTEASRFVPQPPLLELLTSLAAERFPGFELHRGVTVREPLHDVDGRVVGVRAECDGRATEFRGDVVIGCDGRGSVLRRKSGLDGAHDDYRESFDVVWVRTPPLDDGTGPGLSRLYLAPGRILLVLPTPSGELQLGNIIEKGSFGEIRRLGTEGWLRHLDDFVTPDIVAALRSRADDLKLSLLDVQCFNLDRWHAPGLLLIGDAAHPMSPAGGQGLAQAFRDAVAATNELAPLLAEGSPAPAQVDAAIARVQAIRRPDIVGIQRFQRWVPRVLFQRTWYSTVIFGGLGPFLGRVAPGVLQRALDGATRPLRTGSPDLRLEPVPTP